jgi:hypothetical protein
VAQDWPASPDAPKALLAAEQLDPTDPDSLRARLDSLYPDSPSLALVRGEDAPGYRVLEDSLEAFAAAEPVLTPRPGAGIRGVRRGVPADDLVRPPQGAPGGKSVPAEDLPSRRGGSPQRADSVTRRRGLEQ